MNSTTYTEILKKHSVSNTKARALIFSALSGSNKPISMNELIKKCSTIDRVSVYRIIDVFESIGLVHRIQYGWKYKLELSDLFNNHHHHMTCLLCSSIIEFEEPANLDRDLGLIARSKNFIVQQHTLELRGICEKCKNSE